jgi:heme A synthase
MERWRSLESISAYYYTGAVAAFVGMLVTIALFLFTYRGYKNKYHWADRAAAITAAFAALGVAFFPTEAPAGVTALSWWSERIGALHYVSAVLLFTMFAVFALWIFRITPSGKQASADKRWRNNVYLVCGIVIIASIIWAGIARLNRRSIFLPESVALVAFAVSWLVKGYAHRTIADAAHSLLRR